MRNYQYSKLVEKLTPKSPLKKDLINAFLFGGAISCLGQVLRTLYLMTSMTLTEAKALVSITLIVITAILTILGVFDKIGSSVVDGLHSVSLRFVSMMGVYHVIIPINRTFNCNPNIFLRKQMF